MPQERRTAIAHTALDGDRRRVQGLDDHLRGVGAVASRFGSAFGASEWAHLAGLWHDVGKYSEAFQSYLAAALEPDPHTAETVGKIDHSTAGAQHAAARFEILGHILAYVISGHHSGLLDAIGPGACLNARLAKEIEPWDDAPASIAEQPAPPLPRFIERAFARRDGFTVAFYTRMLFSCLVDADFLDTEAFIAPSRQEARPSWPADVLERMEAALDEQVAQFPEATPTVSKGNRGIGVDLARAAVRDACLSAAPLAPGLFSLTVPTGGGKTLSSLAFALRHALHHDLRRVVYVIPFTSIIEQNAAVFRDIFAGRADLEGCVLEHHSNVDVGPERHTSRLAAENWDAPLVVTTSVQFYESLFANRTSRCRKLHRLARSVIVLDEVQALPVDLLEPCLRAIEELATNYGTTLVLCTATQPAVSKRDDFRIGLSGIREIMPNPATLYSQLERVRVQDVGLLSDEELSHRVLSHERVLCIVNTRRHARELYRSIGTAAEHHHLSASMCPAHRSAALEGVRRALKAGEGCRLISTQLIEAGVDIDFPTVYRSLSGLDSIAQAAGRCNREGSLPRGDVHVFRSEHAAAERFLAETANCGRQILELHDDPMSLEAIEHYFRLYYWDQSDRWDAKRVLSDFGLSQDPELPFLFGFRRVGRAFRLIEEQGRPVIVPWGEAGRALREEVLTRGDRAGRDLVRRLQRFTVTIPDRTWLAQSGHGIEIVHDRFPLLVDPDRHYSEAAGLDFGDGEMAFLSF